MTAANVLPHVTASLNAVALVLMLIGFRMIRQKRKPVHRRFMLSAIAVSAVFFAVYLIYHFAAPIFVFRGTGLAKTIYYVLLISHVVLAAVAIPMIFVTLRRALAQSFEAHRRLARWTFAVWVYVSATGVIVYVMLYHLYNPAA